MRKKLVCVLIVLWASVSSVSAATVVGDSPVFTFDTRTVSAVSSALSPVFTSDTRTGRASAAADSVIFTFDTRGGNGAQGSSVPGLFTFDARSGRVLTLAIGGPAECVPGATLLLECWSYSEDGTFAEVGSDVSG